MESSIASAKFLMRRRKFSKAITLLESRAEFYVDDFEYYLTLGTACLYAGVIGDAYNYYQKAREIRLSNANLMLGQAAIFLRRGNIDKALQYYLDILNIEPNNKVAKCAMEFIRKSGDYSTICQWIDSGKITKFYPPIGHNPDIVRNIILGLLVSFTVFVTVRFYVPNRIKKVLSPKEKRLELSTVDVSKTRDNESSDNSVSVDLSESVVRYFMDEKSISKSVDDAFLYFDNYDDNAAMVEINRILNSNASPDIKQKVTSLMEHTKEPSFDSFDSGKERHYSNFTYQDVIKDPYLFNNCYIVWNGRISNAIEGENGEWSFDLLVGYENFKRLEGVVTVHFKNKPSPSIDVEKGVSVLGRIILNSNDIALDGILLYQPLNGKFPQ